MWTRGKDKEQPGKFAFELFDAAGTLIERQGGFATHTEADRAAERAQRCALFPKIIPLDGSLYLTDEEILAELCA